MRNTMTHQGFIGTVEFSEEDNVFHGKLIGVDGTVMYEGDSVASLREDFESAVDDYIDFCKRTGKDPKKHYKGSFNVRIKPVLHQQLVIYSKATGRSLNAAVEEAVSQYVEAGRELMMA